MRILMMLSGLASAMMRAFVRRQDADWAGADNYEIDEAMQGLLEREYGWNTERGDGWYYRRRNGKLAAGAPGRFWPSWSWDHAIEAAKECVEGGMEVDLPLRRGCCGPRHLCVRLLTMCKADRPVPEIVCEECGRTARGFKNDAKANGWLNLYHSRPWPHQKRFPVNGWGLVGRCASCGPRKPGSN